MTDHVKDCGRGDIVAKLMRERGVRGNSRDWVIFYGDGTVVNRHGRITKFVGEVPPVHALEGNFKPKLVHKSNLWAYTDHPFARQFWAHGIAVD